MGYFRSSSTKEPIQTPKENTQKINQQTLVQIPGCTVHLMDKSGQVLELSRGQFTVIQILDKSIPVATIIKVNDIQWPLTRDEPVLKIDRLHYLFSLLINESYPLNYGVTFSDTRNLGSLDSFLRENSCFSGASSSKSKNVTEWEQFGSKIDEYNSVLARAIAEGSGQIVKGILICSNAYTSKVQNGGQMVLNNKKDKNQITTSRTNSIKNPAEDTSAIQETLKRARNLSKMTDNISKAVLDGVVAVTGIVMSSLLFSQAGKAFLCSPTGQLLMASLDALNAIMEAAEVAGKQALSATSSATTRMVTDKMGESAGEATEDVLATAGHCANTAWNVMKIRKAITPAPSVSAGLKRNAGTKLI